MSSIAECSARSEKLKLLGGDVSDLAHTVEVLARHAQGDEQNQY
jgi:hypothetical protein